MTNTYYRDEPVTPSLDRAPACPFDPAPSLTALRAEHPIVRMDAPQHTRFRKLPAGEFTVRRTNLLTEITRERLGVPYEDRALPEAGTAEAQYAAFGGRQLKAGDTVVIAMRVAFPALLVRFPTPRPALAAEEPSLRTGPSQVYGAHTWDRG